MAQVEKVRQTTPMCWIKKKPMLLGKSAEKYPAEVGNFWDSDETTMFIKKEDQKKCYQWINSRTDGEYPD